MSSSVTVEDGKYGRRAVLYGPWDHKFAARFVAEDITELELNQGKGWAGGSLQFLEQLPHLQCLEVLHLGIKDDSPVHLLRNLRGLHLTTYCNTPVDFSAFPRLEWCALEWRPKSESLFDCVTLTDLFVNRYRGKESTPFGNLINLESLGILNSPIRSLEGLAPLQRLRSLRIANLRKVESLAGLARIASLEELDINSCRGISAIREVESLPRLRVLSLIDCGEIASLAPIDKLKHLKELFFANDTKIVDGDLWDL